jgi:Cys-rich protein (TIGR01571 family)
VCMRVGESWRELESWRVGERESERERERERERARERERQMGGVCDGLFRRLPFRRLVYNRAIMVLIIAIAVLRLRRVKFKLVGISMNTEALPLVIPVHASQVCTLSVGVYMCSYDCYLQKKKKKDTERKTHTLTQQHTYSLSSRHLSRFQRFASSIWPHTHTHTCTYTHTQPTHIHTHPRQPSHTHTHTIPHTHTSTHTYTHTHTHVINPENVPQAPSRFREGLFDCTSDPISCCLAATCCGGSVVGAVAHELDGHNACAVSCIWSLLQCFTLCGNIFVGAYYRSHLRERYNIPGNIINDCVVHACCPVCLSLLCVCGSGHIGGLCCVYMSLA